MTTTDQTPSATDRYAFDVLMGATPRRHYATVALTVRWCGDCHGWTEPAGTNCGACGDPYLCDECGAYIDLAGACTRPEGCPADAIPAKAAAYYGPGSTPTIVEQFKPGSGWAGAPPHARPTVAVLAALRAQGFTTVALGVDGSPRAADFPIAELLAGTGF